MKTFFKICGIYSLIIVSICSCLIETDNLVEHLTLTTTITKSLVDENHTSEGFLVSNQNKIIHFFRYDKGKNGHHIGNTGYIVKRESFNQGNTWTENTLVFQDEFDNRNVRGGITKDGEIILFFRRYDATMNKPIDLNYIISYDNGNNWTERKTLDFNLDFVNEVWIDNFIELENSKYLLPIHGISYCELRTFNIFNNEIQISDKIWEWNYTDKNEYKIDEPTFSYLGNNKIIGLFRDESKEPGSNYLQVISNDQGLSWTDPKRTNICDPYFSPSPLIFFNNDSKKIISIGTDRRLSKNGNYLSENSKIWIYQNEIHEVFENPKGYTLLDSLNRPNPSNFRFYGYPIFIKIEKNTFLIVFTESTYDGITEDADFYQFKIYNE